MNSSQNSASIDVHTLDKFENNIFFTLFCLNFAFLNVFLAITIFGQKAQNTRQNLYNIVELFVLYLLIELLKDLLNT
jgi:hypothetical protein